MDTIAMVAEFLARQLMLGIFWVLCWQQGNDGDRYVFIGFCCVAVCGLFGVEIKRILRSWLLFDLRAWDIHNTSYSW